MDDNSERRHQREVRTTQDRITVIDSKRLEQTKRDQQARREEFQRKSDLQALKWDMTVQKATPDQVLSGLSAVKAPLPPMA